jgi:protein gp37
MSRNTKIGWCDHSFNLWHGCQKIAAGCANCYAERDDKRRYPDLKLWGANSVRKVNSLSYYRQPIAWNREAGKADVRQRVFCASMSDVFEDYKGTCVNQVGELTGFTADRLRGMLWDTVERTSNLDWLILTKRAGNVEKMIPPCWRERKWPANLWLGLSASTELEVARAISWFEQFSTRIMSPFIRFVSCEPMLELMDLLRLQSPLHSLAPFPVDWVIFGAESGPSRRRCDHDWIRIGISQCEAVGIPAFVKQLEIDGRISTDPSEWAEDLRVQEWPRERTTGS